MLTSAGLTPSVQERMIFGSWTVELDLFLGIPWWDVTESARESKKLCGPWEFVEIFRLLGLDREDTRLLRSGLPVKIPSSKLWIYFCVSMFELIKLSTIWKAEATNKQIPWRTSNWSKKWRSSCHLSNLSTQALSSAHQQAKYATDIQYRSI